MKKITPADKPDCFAFRNDGECHALINKNCENCKFYTPKEKIKDNPFYKYSWINKRKMEGVVYARKIRKEQIMR